ncbi:hypothetical protein HC766_01530 [Candidatus Gracilibacteria bacterium]|nr:hypothetical protein [Candidatus Gracilibacteria bacterium]
MVIIGVKSKHTLRINLQNVEEFNIPAQNAEESEYEIEVDKMDFLEANRVAVTSVGNPRVVSQPEFLSVCLHVDSTKDYKQMVMVSTDRFRMSQTNLGVKLINSKEDLTGENYLVDPKSLSLLAVCDIEDEKIIINFEKNFMWVHFDSAKMAFRYREGKFPDWKKILPSSFSCSFKLNVVELIMALKQVYFSARTNAINKTVTIEVKPKNNEIVFVAKTEDGNSSESSLELANYEGVEEDWKQSFNADYLIDYVSTITTELVLWEANPGKPSVLSPNEAKEKQLCLVSGLR